MLIKPMEVEIIMSESGSNTPPNPYQTMTDDEIKKNFASMAEVLNERSLGLDYYDTFKLEKTPTVSEEDRKKIEQHEKLSAVAQQMVEVLGGTPPAEPQKLDPNLERFAKTNIDTVVRDIRGIDKDIPIDGIVNSNKSLMDKLDTLNHVKEIAEYHGTVAKSLREKIKSEGNQISDKLSNPNGLTSWGDQTSAWQKMANAALGVDK